MNPEIEAAALDGVLTGRRARKGLHLPPGSPCANCGSTLRGDWCHQCGQFAEDFHRSIGRLAMEAVEGLTHLDGRFWTTVPQLILHPARLTRAYIDGHRAAQIPPLRLFLVVLLLVFLAGSVGGGRTKLATIDSKDPTPRTLTADRLKDVKVQFGSTVNKGATAWLQQRLATAMSDPERFKLAMESQGERFALLSLPLATLILSMLFAFKREFFVFDHTIFALHSLSFQGLLITVASLIGALWEPAGTILFLAAPVHLFAHMRGFYRTGVFSTLARMTLLAMISLVGFVILMLLLVLVGLNAMGPS